MAGVRWKRWTLTWGNRTAIVVSLAAVGFLAVAARGQPEDATIRTAGQVELARLVDLCAERLGLRIEYDPKALQGVTVTLRLREGLAVDELWNVTNLLLAARGFATVQMPGSDLITITKLATAQELARVETQALAAATAGYVSVLYELRYRDYKQLAPAIQPLLSKSGGAVTALGDSNRMLIADFKPRVEEVLGLIEQLDVPIQSAVIETIPVLNLPAAQLAASIGAAVAAAATLAGDTTPLTGKVLAIPDGNALVLVAPAGEVNQWRALIKQFDQRQALETRSYVPVHFSVQEVAGLLESVARDTSPRGSGSQWQVVTDDLTGTLIVTATASEHAAIEALLKRLEAVPDAARRPVRSFPIRNRNVNEILDVLTRLVEAGVLETAPAASDDGLAAIARQQSDRTVLPPGAEPLIPPRPQPAPSAAATSTHRGPGSGEQKPAITLTADEGTNTIVAVGEARRLDQLAQLIRTLDVRQPQVMLEVLVVTLTDVQTRDLGIELEGSITSGSTMFRLASLFGLGMPGLGQLVPPTGEGGTALILDPGDFRVVIRALETLNQGRTLNIPKVLVSNNQQSSLDSVLQQPFVSTNASNTVATTSFGGTQDAGTTIAVRPQITEGDHLLLDYSISLSQFTGDSTDPAIPPPRQQNNLTSVASIPDGHVIVVGGLETVIQSEAVSQVPILAGIPAVGELFKSRSRTFNRAHFYVFIKASIMRQDGFEDLKYLSDRDVAAAGVDDGWPQVEPRVIR